MPFEDKITFATSGLDRAAHRRGDALALLNDPNARVVPVWRGKPLVDADGLVGLAADHRVFADAVADPIFLGLDEAGPRFARDVSAWDPGTPVDLDGFRDRTEQQHPGLPAGQVFAELRAEMTRLSRRDAELAATARALIEWHRIHGFCANCGAQSTPAQAGWQRDCAACGRHHFPRTDPVVIMLITHGDEVLVGRSPGWPEGMYSLLAGFIEPGETMEAAVRREVFEEAGVRVGEVGYLASQPWPYPASLMFGCWGQAETTRITLDPAEVEDGFWISRSEMEDVFAGTHPRMREPRRGAIAHSLLEAWVNGATETR
ncbi:NAD(+) diphosphatase [Tropicimonas sp. S265A]|uniref:NAD(+) diphosphatase n=1 Tax=Tropicimonas sp. S265A TaxID=3415134 RepID=UPI003C7C033F